MQEGQFSGRTGQPRMPRDRLVLPGGTLLNVIVSPDRGSLHPRTRPRKAAPPAVSPDQRSARCPSDFTVNASMHRPPAAASRTRCPRRRCTRQAGESSISDHDRLTHRRGSNDRRRFGWIDVEACAGVDASVSRWTGRIQPHDDVRQTRVIDPLACRSGAAGCGGTSYTGTRSNVCATPAFGLAITRTCAAADRPGPGRGWSWHPTSTSARQHRCQDKCGRFHFFFSSGRSTTAACSLPAQPESTSPETAGAFATSLPSIPRRNVLDAVSPLIIHPAV